MAKKTVYFVEGIAIEPEYIHVLSYLHEFDLEPTEFSRLYSYDGGDWAHDEWPIQLVSATRAVIDDVPHYFYLGRRGEVIVRYGGQEIHEKIVGPGTGAGTFGYASEIKQIGQNIYVCGGNRQVYVRKSDGWKPIHGKILHRKPDSVDFSFESIDGSDDSNIYAVGFEGEIFHYDGKKWTQIDSPTNIHLNRVLCVSADVVYACGDDGVLLQGNGKVWKIIPTEDIEDNLWGMAVFNENLYVCSMTKLYTLTEDGLVEQNIPLTPKPELYQLYSVDGVLWSFGAHDLVRFDGEEWKRFVCPDNA